MCGGARERCSTTSRGDAAGVPMEGAESGSDNDESSVEPSLALLDKAPAALPTLEQKLGPPPSERLVLNVGGRRYETFVGE